MDENDMVLAMAICELLGKTVEPKDVEKAFNVARKKLERLWCNQPREARDFSCASPRLKAGWARNFYLSSSRNHCRAQLRT